MGNTSSNGYQPRIFRTHVNVQESPWILSAPKMFSNVLFQFLIRWRNGSRSCSLKKVKVCSALQSTSLCSWVYKIWQSLAHLKNGGLVFFSFAKLPIWFPNPSRTRLGSSIHHVWQATRSIQEHRESGVGPRQGNTTLMLDLKVTR